MRGEVYRAVQLLAAGAALLSGVVASRCGAQAAAPRAVVAGETLQGIWVTPLNMAAFLGIPYAAPPVGRLRWQPPRPHVSSDGVRDASHFGHACLQPLRLNDPSGADDSEDCLTLNVWTGNLARDSVPRPVIVWIHGGANVSGASSRPQYDGAQLARQGVIVVSLNYRLGVMGFFAHPALSREGRAHASGNYALLDILAALEWVRRNVATFGGDPTRVTVYGQSAGANNIMHLMASPLSKGLFHRAIAQSGAPMDGLASLETAEQFGVVFARSIGVAPDSLARDREVLQALRDVPAMTVLQVQSVFVRSGIFQPIVDGLVLRQMTARVFDEGRQLAVPLLVGSTALEMSTLPGSMPTFERTLGGYRQWTRDTFGRSADSVLSLYPAATDADVDLAARRLVTDFFFTCQTRMAARAMGKVGATAFVYLFTRVPAGQEALGASHAADIDYIFNARSPAPRRDVTDSLLSAAMVRYWVQFATTGSPNGSAGVAWPAYNPADDVVLDLGAVIAPRSPLGGAMCGLMEPVLRQLWRTRH